MQRLVTSARTASVAQRLSGTSRRFMSDHGPQEYEGAEKVRPAVPAPPV